MKNRAFTLIELLVVVLIIGILAAIAVPQYQKAVLKSRFSTLKNMTKSLWQAEEAYYLANGEYTGFISDLDISMPKAKYIHKEAAETYDQEWHFFDNFKCSVFLRKGDYISVACYLYKDNDLFTHRVSYGYSKGFGDVKFRRFCGVHTDKDIDKNLCVSETGKVNDIFYD